MGTAVSVGTRLGLTLTVSGVERGGCVGVESTTCVESGILQAEVRRSRNPIKIFFCITLVTVGYSEETWHLV